MAHKQTPVVLEQQEAATAQQGRNSNMAAGAVGVRLRYSLVWDTGGHMPEAPPSL
jgi:hypothetical protein